MTIQQLNYAIIISEMGSLNKASEVLYIAQPSLTSSIQELEKECPDMGYAGDSYKKELIARWLFLNQFEANMANVRKDTLDDLTKAITTYENRAVFYIQKSIKYNNRAFRDNQVAISRTLIGAEAVRVNLPYEITGSKVHPLGYW